MILERTGAVIEVYSPCNTWIDVIFIVPEGKKEEAMKVLEEAYDFFWSDEGQDWCFGDLFEARLKDAGITYEAFYTNETDEEEGVA